MAGMLNSFAHFVLMQPHSTSKTPKETVIIGFYENQ